MVQKVQENLDEVTQVMAEPIEVATHSSPTDNRLVLFNSHTQPNLSLETPIQELTEEIPTETNTYIHLKSYPIANSWLRIFHSIPFPRIIRPFLYRLAFSGSARGYTRRIDDYIDIQILGSLDRALPQVKTLRMRDIRDFLTSPFVRIYTFSRLRIDDSIDVTDRMVIKPTRRAIHDVRSNISGEIGELSAAGGPFIRSRIDPMVKPLNENMIRYINETFPEDPLHSGELGDRTNELSYALRIVNGEINRSRNLATKRIEGIREIPASTLKRMAEVYRDNQKKRGDNGDSRVVMMIASLDTARTLAAGGYQIVFATNGEDK